MDNAYNEIPLPGPGNNTLLAKVFYTQRETHGVTVLIVASTISLVAVVITLFNISLQLIKSLGTFPTVEQAFMRTHISYYFICLMVADLMQAIGSIMSAKWVQHQSVILNNFCVAQGALKNAANVAASLWILVIAIHTWTLLFLRFKPSNTMFIAVVLGVWSFVGFIVILGPAALQKPNLGPYFGISGFWCWISDNYPGERIGLEYFFMFFSAIASFVLYTLVFLRFRGNVTLSGRRVHFRRVKASMAWKLPTGEDVVDGQTVRAMKQMLWYPVVYTVIFLPIAISRFLAWGGGSIPFEVTIFSDTVFVLGGFINSILFTTTRRIIPMSAILPAFFRGRISKPTLIFSGSASREAPATRSENTESDSEEVKQPDLLPPPPHTASGETPVDTHGSDSPCSSSDESEYEELDLEKQSAR